MTLAQVTTIGRNVCTAFSRDSITGSVYVEAFKLDDVQRTVRDVHGVLSYRGNPSIELIPLDDRVALLEMNAPTTIRRNSWVRITRRGRYRNDLGLVHTVDESSLTAKVYLVPRIPDRKRKRRCRPKPALFDATTVEATFGAGLVVKENDGWLFKGNRFVNGLEVQNFELYELSDRSVNATHDELELFHRTCDTWVEDAIVLSGGTVSLRVSDKIRVVTGPYLASTGVVVDIIGDIVKIQSDSFPDPQQVRRWEVCKRFDRGDFVHVVHGLDRGVEGFIIDMDEGFVTLCCRTIHEVSCSSLHSMICDAR